MTCALLIDFGSTFTNLRAVDLGTCRIIATAHDDRRRRPPVAVTAGGDPVGALGVVGAEADVVDAELAIGVRGDARAIGPGHPRAGQRGVGREHFGESDLAPDR